jgi:membrane protein
MLITKVEKFFSACLYILRTSYKYFSITMSAETTASLAYYSLFSIFPLALLLISASSLWLGAQTAQQRVIEYLSEIFPVSQEMLFTVIKEVIQRRGAFTFISTTSLIWSSSGFFNLLVRNINRPWLGMKPRHFVRTRLQALSIILVLGLLFLVSILFTTGMEMVNKLNLPLWQEFRRQNYLRSFTSDFLPMLLRLVMVWSLYYWVPNTQVPRTSALVGAVFVTITWRMLTDAFTWYLNSGFAHYDLIYGSLGRTITLMLAFYFGNYILLFGNHLSAAIARHKNQENISRAGMVNFDYEIGLN